MSPFMKLMLFVLAALTVTNFVLGHIVMGLALTAILIGVTAGYRTSVRKP